MFIVLCLGRIVEILLVRSRTPGRKAIITHVISVFESEDVESWNGCFVILSEKKLRVRRPSL